MRMLLARGALTASLAALALTVVPALAGARPAPLVVCQHGCRYPTIQSAVNASGRDAVIDVRPGRYAEGVVVSGHRHDGLSIVGLGKAPAAVYLDGTKARVGGRAAQNAIAGRRVDDLTLQDMKAEHYAADGFLVDGCRGYTMRRLVAGFNRADGLSAVRCVGGRMTGSTGYGNGGAAFSIAGTPWQSRPAWSSVDHDTGDENVLGYLGANSKYVRITDSSFYDNGDGVVPATLSTVPFAPADEGIVARDRIFWNDFDYHRAGSPVRAATGLPDLPVGAGVILLGTTGWTVTGNQIFGNWLWGAAAVSDPTNPTGRAESVDDAFEDNAMGAGGRDRDGADLFNDGSGHGTCFRDNGAATLDPSATDPTNELYPTCPTTAGTGTVEGDATQVAELGRILAADPATGQEAFWHRHPHIRIKGIAPVQG